MSWYEVDTALKVCARHAFLLPDQAQLGANARALAKARADLADTQANLSSTRAELAARTAEVTNRVAEGKALRARLAELQGQLPARAGSGGRCGQAPISDLQGATCMMSMIH